MRPVILDVKGTSLEPQEKDYLAHPLVAGVILFSRNYESLAQLKELVKAIRASSAKPLIIGVDHEGGRVQRFREGFTTLPAAGSIIDHSANIEQAKQVAQASAFVMASELIACDIDISFAPVIDINGISDVIKERAFSDKPAVVTQLATSYITGMRMAGMASTGKHFPGHGSVKADSHIALPIDQRSSSDIFNIDMQPFAALIKNNLLDAVMPSHVVYQQCDDLPCGFSPYWLQTILKKQLSFKGAIISDDLSMHGASFVGDHLSRAQSAINAGCDFILACNDTPAALSILDGLKCDIKESEQLISRLRSQQLKDPKLSVNGQIWAENKQLLTEFAEQV